MQQLNFYKDTDIYRLTARMFAFIVLTIVLCRVTRGYIMPVFTLVGVCMALGNKLGWALVFFVMMPFFVILNPVITGNASSLYGLSLRLGPLLIGLILAMLGASRQGRHRLPLIGIVPFLLAAVISSVDGWAPSVSMAKLIFFCVFLFGIWFGTQNLQQRPKDILLLRSYFLAMASLLVFGSVVTIAVPSIGYATSFSFFVRAGNAELAQEALRNLRANNDVTLFCGITNHSQALAPLLAVAVGWVLCDMLLLERRFRWLHLCIVVFALPLTYLTRSRVGLISIVAALYMSAFYAARKIQLPSHLRARLSQGIMVSGALLVVVAIIAQVSTGAMSRWMRKTNEEDERSLGEALTSSRMGLLEQSLYEFRRNPLFGSGFQVDENTPELVRINKGFMLSAPIEKGITPVMVLGETGILGEVCFILFIATFYGTCIRRKYVVTLSLFTVFFVTNMGEATFFSPGGIGGIIWIVSAVGGFTIDTYLLYRRQLEQQWAMMGFQMTAPAFELVEDASGRRRLVESERTVRRYGLRRG